MRYNFSMNGMNSLLVLVGAFLLVMLFPSKADAADCSPTEPDLLGPFYKPNAPVRSRVGKGYVLQGTVRSSSGCKPVARAVLEFWLAGPEGEYDDAHRATVFSGKDGSYWFESNVPVPYSGRPPHIHIRISAPGFETLITQHYPNPGKTEAIFDLVIVPSQ